MSQFWTEEFTQRLREDRTIAILGPLSDETAELIIAQLMFLASEDPRADIRMQVVSPGGPVTTPATIFETMRDAEPDIVTIAAGPIAGLAVWLIACGSPGKRLATPQARFELHPPQAPTPVDPEAIKEMLALRSTLDQLLAARTGQTLDWVRRACAAGLVLDPLEALSSGLIDQIRAKI